MPQKLNMVISNGNHIPGIHGQRLINIESSSLQRQIVSASPPLASSSKAPTALNAPFLARIHNVKPGCGSCGRH
jgi:hypothetical protein